MKTIISIALVALPLTFAAFADNAATISATTSNTSTNENYVDMITGKPWTPGSKFTIEQLKARDERVLKKTGGFLQQPAEGPLALLLDAREKPTATIDEVARLYRLATKLDIDVAREPQGEARPLAFARERMARTAPLLLVAIVDDDDLPALSVFPEERIGIVNARRLKGGDDPSAPEMRVSKEVWRAIGFIGGLGFSPAENDMMQPYYTLEEIDASRYPFIQPMNMARMQKFWTRFGVKRARRIPYRVAVKEGWAPAPTNDYQRAVWDEVKEQAATNAPAAK